MLDSIYHMILSILCNHVLGVKMLRFCLIYVMLLWPSLRNITNYVNH